MYASIFERGADGLPTTTQIAEMSGPRLQRFEGSHQAMWGPTRARVRWACTREEAFTWAEDRLGCMYIHYSNDGWPIWWGMVWGVRMQLGRRQLLRSLDGWGNRVRGHYNVKDWSTSPPKDGGVRSVVVDDTDLQSQHGVFEVQRNFGPLTAARATARATTALNETKRLRYDPEAGMLGGPVESDFGMELLLEGPYRALWRESYTAAVAGDVEIATLITTILAAKCPWISTRTDQIETTGSTYSQTFSKYEYPGDIIKRLCKIAGYVFQITEDRDPVLTAMAQSSATPTYYERPTGTIQNAAGIAVPAYTVRPNSIIQLMGLVPATVNLSVAVDSIENMYLAETTWRSTAPDTVSYKPALVRRGRIVL